jgi:predicted ArsR family transcriptional regulator
MGTIVNETASSLRMLAALEDETRHRLYLFVRASDQPVTREEAATDAGISGRLAAFHLDKLAALGLLDTHYARKPGRTGPGAGRTSKYYRPSSVELDVSIPERRYAAMGRILAAAIASERRGESAQHAAVRIAREQGHDEGRTARRSRGGKREPSLGSVRATLSSFGFEPAQRDDGSIVLRSCPYERLARELPDVACSINHAFVEGLLTGMGTRSLEASFEPGDVGCCVRVRASG